MLLLFSCHVYGREGKKKEACGLKNKRGVVKMEDNTTTTTTVEVTLSSSSTVEKDEWGDKVREKELNVLILN